MNIIEEFNPALAIASVKTKTPLEDTLRKNSFGKLSTPKFIPEKKSSRFIFYVVILFFVASIFQTLAWYYNIDNKFSFWIGFVMSMVFVFFEYLFMIPANNMGYQVFNLVQLAMMAEIINWIVFIIYVKVIRKNDEIGKNCWLGLMVMFFGILISYT